MATNFYKLKSNLFARISSNSYRNSRIIPDRMQLEIEAILCYTPAMAKKKSVKKTSDKPLHVAVIKQMLSLATSGFGLVAALAWNNVIQEFVNNYIKKLLPGGSGLLSLFIYAILITCLAVLVTYHITKLLAKVDPEQE